MAAAAVLAAERYAADAILQTQSPAQTKSSSQTSYTFSFTPFLRQNAIAALTSNVRVCPNYAAGNCPLGRRCPDRHPTPTQQAQHHYGRGNDNFVCKHWLKGLCKKGDMCDYLHEYNLRKMSECQFYNQNGYCQNGDECLYVHVKEDSKLPLCDDYNAGFCKLGPKCGKRHVRKKLCEFYMAGFCPEGPSCKFGVHLKSSGLKEADLDGDRVRRDRLDELDKRDEEGKRNSDGNRTEAQEVVDGRISATGVTEGEQRMRPIVRQTMGYCHRHWGITKPLQWTNYVAPSNNWVILELSPETYFVWVKQVQRSRKLMTLVDINI